MGSTLKGGMNKDVLAIGGLVLVLFLLMVIVAITFIGAEELKKVTCTTADSDYSWNQSACWTNENANVSANVDAIDNIDDVEAVILVVLGLLTLVVIVGLFAIVIKAALGFAKSF